MRALLRDSFSADRNRARWQMLRATR